MHKSSAWWLLAVTVFSSAAPAAQLSLLDTTGNAHQVDIDIAVAPTGSFAVNVHLDLEANDEVNGLTFVLQSFDSNTIFSLTGRTISGLAMTGGGTLSDPITENADLLGSPQNLLGPTNTRDIGLTGPVGAKVVAGGVIMALTLSYTNQLVPGDYRINIGPDPVTNDNAFVEHALPIGANYVVHVVPEPGTALLMAVCAGAPCGIRRRRINTALDINK